MSPEPRKAQPVWYRSLYWRIGLGFVAFLLVVVAAQTGAVVWLISRLEVAPGPPPSSVGRLVAGELASALNANPKLDIQEFLRQQYEERVPIVIVMRDGRVVSSDGMAPPEELLTEARARLSAGAQAFGPPPGPRPEGPGRAGREGWDGRGERGPGFGPGPGPGGGRRGGPPRRGGAPVIVDGQLVGLVMANPQSTWQQLGRTVLIVGLVLVAVGTTSAALLIFGPVRRRLGSLENAARRVGSGDLNAQAREDGGDEVAALAQTFNQMTRDLGIRAEQLQAVDRQRRLLLADVSHELMTPLTAMRGYLETLTMSGIVIDAETRARYLGIIGDETRRLELIVGDLLEMARLEGSSESIEKEDVPLEDLFGRVVARHERDAALKNVVFRTSIAPGAEIVVGDPLRLEQALQNLAANALRHTPAGGRIELLAEPPRGRDVTIVVRDNGSGISPEHLPHLFDRFYKVESSRGGERTGSGLGLSIVKAIVERHNGSISVKSDPGRGTEFTIQLPIST